VHRALTARGVTNVVVDSTSIDTNRRARQAKSDRLDTAALLAKLGRFVGGERGLWSVVHVPSGEDEDRRQLHRELFLPTRERTRVVNRIKTLLALHGIVLEPPRGLPAAVPDMTSLLTWNGDPLPPAAHARLVREWHRLTFLRKELRALIAARLALLRAGTDPVVPMVRRLLALRGIGDVGAWIYTLGVLRVAAVSQSSRGGGSCRVVQHAPQERESSARTGISKSGNQYLRALAIELAWSWLRHQPQSALSRWYRHRFANGGPRVRRIGIVALARKLLIALWR